MWDLFTIEGPIGTMFLVFKIVMATISAMVQEVLGMVVQFMFEYKFELFTGIYDVYASIANLWIGTWSALTMHKSMWHSFKTSDEIDYMKMNFAFVGLFKFVSGIVSQLTLE